MSLDFTLYMDVDTGGSEPYHIELFDANITHNLSHMAREAGLYDTLWNPPLNTNADSLIPDMSAGLNILESRPQHFKKWDSPNGWGRYENLVNFTKRCLAACKEHPKAKVYIST